MQSKNLFHKFISIFLLIFFFVTLALPIQNIFAEDPKPTDTNPPSEGKTVSGLNILDNVKGILKGGQTQGFGSKIGIGDAGQINQEFAVKDKGSSTIGSILEPVTKLVLKVLNFLLNLAGILSVLMIIYGSYMMILDARTGKDDGVKKGKTILQNAVLGLVLVVFARSITFTLDSGMQKVVSFLTASETAVKTWSVAGPIFGIIKESLFYIGIFAVLMVTYGGYKFMFSAGDKAKAGEGLSVVKTSFIGVAMSTFAYAITSFVLTIGASLKPVSNVDSSISSIKGADKMLSGFVSVDFTSIEFWLFMLTKVKNFSIPITIAVIVISGFRMFIDIQKKGSESFTKVKMTILYAGVGFLVIYTAYAIVETASKMSYFNPVSF